MDHKIAIVGYGGMGSYHVNLQKNAGNITLTGIWDIKEERREAARERGIFVYDSLEHLLADETVLQDIPVYSDGMTTPRSAQQPRRRLVAPVYEFEWNTEEQQWDISAGDIDGIIIGELDTANWWLQPLGAPSWLGVDHLGKVALTTWQTYEDVSECDYVYIEGHQYMLVDGTVDEESGLCEFRALEVAQPVTTQGRDFSDDFSDDFS